MDAAASIFREKGYAQTKLSEIAEAVGTQAGSLYYHFESREHLVEEVLAEAMLRTTTRVKAALDSLPPDSSVIEKVRAGLREHLQSLLGEGNEYAGAYYKIIDQVPSSLREKYTEYPREYANIWRSVIQDGQRNGELRSDLNPTILRLQLLGAVIWSVEWYHADGPRTPLEIADQMADCFVYGAAPRR